MCSVLFARIVSYLVGLQEEILSEAAADDQSGRLNLSKVSIQSAMSRLQMKESRKTAEFLCDQWSDDDLLLMLDYRLQYMHSRESADVDLSDMMKDGKAALHAFEHSSHADWKSRPMEASVKELFVETMARDVSSIDKREAGGMQVEGTQEEVEGIFDMLKERYGMEEVERKIVQRESKWK